MTNTCLECGTYTDGDLYCCKCENKTLTDPEFWIFYIRHTLGVQLSKEQAQELIDTGSVKP